MSSSSTIIVLRSSDGKTFEVDEVVALESQTIRNMVEDGSADINNVLLPGITSNILSKVIEYCKKHTDDNVSHEQLKAFDAEFVNVDRDTLFDITRGAYYLNVVNLVNLTCQAVADMLRDKTPEEIREILNMENDYTPEEEEEERRANAWALYPLYL